MPRDPTSEELKTIIRAMISDPPNRVTITQDLIDPLLRPVLNGPFGNENAFLEEWLKKASCLNGRYELEVSDKLADFLSDMGSPASAYMVPYLDFHVVKAHKRSRKVVGTPYRKELADVVYLVRAQLQEEICMSRFVQVKRVTELKAPVDLSQFYLYSCDPGFQSGNRTLRFGDFEGHHYFHYWFIDGDVDSSNCMRDLCDEGVPKEILGPVSRRQKVSPSGMRTRDTFWSIVDSLDDLRRAPLLPLGCVRGELLTQNRLPLRFCEKGPPNRKKESTLDFSKTYEGPSEAKFESPQRHLLETLLFRHGIECSLVHHLYSAGNPNPVPLQIVEGLDGSPEDFNEWDRDRDAAVVILEYSMKELDGGRERPSLDRWRGK